MAYSQDGEFEYEYESGEHTCTVRVEFTATWEGPDRSVGINGPYVDEINADKIYIDDVEVVWDSILKEWVLAVFPCVDDPADFLQKLNKELDDYAETAEAP